MDKLSLGRLRTRIEQTIIRHADDNLDGYGRLARGVIILALQDIVYNREKPKKNTDDWSYMMREREKAKRFIESDGLDFWGGYCGLHPEMVREFAKGVEAYQFETN